MEGGGYMRKQDTLLLMIAVSGEMPADLAEHIIGSVSYTAAVITRLKQEGYISVRNKPGIKDMCCVQRVRDMSFHNIVKMLLLFYRGQWRQTM